MRSVLSLCEYLTLLGSLGFVVLVESHNLGRFPKGSNRLYLQALIPRRHFPFLNPTKPFNALPLNIPEGPQHLLNDINSPENERFPKHPAYAGRASPPLIGQIITFILRANTEYF